MKTKSQVSTNVTMNKPDEKTQGMKVRRVVTGHDAKGRAVFVRDEKVDGTPIPGLGELAFLWNADEPATYPNAGNNPAAPGIFPPVGGIRYIIGTYLPGVSCVSNSFTFNKLERGGSRTIRAYSFYVTYWKHTNARTAKPAVCPPPMYKIMYKKFEGRVSSRPLNAMLRSSPSRYRTASGSFQVDAMRVSPGGARDA